MSKLQKIEEACNTLLLKSNVSILEEAAAGNITDVDVAKSKLVIHENLQFIKKSLTSGILEETQTLLAQNWTQAILEDMSLSDMVDQGKQYVGLEDEGLSAGEAAALAGAGALGTAGAIRYGAPAVAAGYKARTNSDANATGTMMAARQAAAGQVANDVAAVKDAASHANLYAANKAADASNAARRMAFDAGRTVSNAAGQAKAQAANLLRKVRRAK